MEIKVKTDKQIACCRCQDLYVQGYSFQPLPWSPSRLFPTQYIIDGNLSGISRNPVWQGDPSRMSESHRVMGSITVSLHNVANWFYWPELLTYLLQIKIRYSTGVTCIICIAARKAPDVSATQNPLQREWRGPRCTWDELDVVMRQMRWWHLYDVSPNFRMGWRFHGTGTVDKSFL